jgi:hypothetical protein
MPECFDGANLGRSLVLAAALALAGGQAQAREAVKAIPPSERLLPAAAEGPVTIVVSTDAQRLTVYDGDRPVANTVISTGTPDHPTPHGVFSVIEKQVFHRSTIYSGAPMPYMQRLTWSGVAMHEGHVTGRPASHGCVRLPAAFAKELFRYTRRGARVVISRPEVRPSDFGAALPIEPPQTRRYVMGEQADEGRFAGEIAPPDASVNAPARIGQRDVSASSPVTALVNRKTGRIYVRRAFAPIFEAPITIDEPERPLGAHLFVSFGKAGGDMNWAATSVPARMREAMLGARNQPMAPLSFDATADEALKRIHLAPGTAARLSALLGPGAALIISDEGARGKESVAGTNFIALVE